MPYTGAADGYGLTCECTLLFHQYNPAESRAGQLGPGSKVRFRKPLTNLALNATDLPSRPNPGSAYVRSRPPYVARSENPVSGLQLTTYFPFRPSDS